MLQEQDEATLLKIFPTEIWLLILEHVKDANEYHKFCNASLHFRTLLLPRATQLLFSQAAKPILLYVQRYMKTRSKFLLSFLVNKYREVCKAWRNGIDHELQTQHFNLPVQSECPEFENTFEDCLECNFEKFGSSTDITKFDQHFNSTHQESLANPFLCRGVKLALFRDVYIHDDGEEEVLEPPDDYYRACTPLLEKYGHHISSCVIFLDQGFLDLQGISDFYQKLKDFLRLMPNLQKVDVEILRAELLRHQEEFVATGCIRNPFPSLARLRFLTLLGVHPAAVRSLLQANPQVEAINATNHCSREVLETILADAANVKFLLLKPNDEAVLDAFCNAREFSAPVENLRLNARGVMHRGQPEHWGQIFTAIQSHFGQSLRQLSLYLPKLNALRFEGELALPHLQILELEMEELVPLDFLLPLKNFLEQLSVRTFASSTYRLARRRCSVVKLCEFWMGPEMSNVWELFPKLKLLRTGKRSEHGVWYSCTREQWRSRQMHL